MIELVLGCEVWVGNPALALRGIVALGAPIGAPEFVATHLCALSGLQDTQVAWLLLSLRAQCALKRPPPTGHHGLMRFVPSFTGTAISLPFLLRLCNLAGQRMSAPASLEPLRDARASFAAVGFEPPAWHRRARPHSRRTAPSAPAELNPSSIICCQRTHGAPPLPGVNARFLLFLNVSHRRTVPWSACS